MIVVGWEWGFFTWIYVDRYLDIYLSVTFNDKEIEIFMRTVITIYPFSVRIERSISIDEIFQCVRQHDEWNRFSCSSKETSREMFLWDEEFVASSLPAWFVLIILVKYQSLWVATIVCKERRHRYGLDISYIISVL